LKTFASSVPPAIIASFLENPDASRYGQHLISGVTK
jgi:hypothetical protein